MNNITLQKVLSEIAGRHRLADFQKRIEDIQPGRIRIRVAFLGEFNTGKSTLLNALLRKRVLPMFATPTTANITEIDFGTEEVARVQHIGEDGVPEAVIIPWSELGNEIVNTAPDKKILLTFKEAGPFSPDLLLVDTPGVESVQATHDDVTYGYLPDVDVAIIVLTPHQGTAPKSLVQFLQRFPPPLLAKIYFVIGRKDELPPSELAVIRERVRQELGPMFVHSRILLVSGTLALDAGDDGAKRKQSGIEELEAIIQREIPDRKQAIEAERIYALLQSAREELSQLLKQIAETINWSTEQLDEEMAQLKAKIAALQKEIANYRGKFSALKERALQAIGPIIREHTAIIGARAVRSEPYEDLIASMVDEIRSQIDLSMKELTNIEFRTLGKNIESLLQAMIEQESARIKEIASLITDAGTFALTAWLVPGPTAGLDPDEAAVAAGVVFAEKAANYKKKGSGGFGDTIGGFISGLGAMIKGMNPLEKLKNTVLPYIVNPRLARVLTKRMTLRLQALYETLGQTIDQEIEKRYLIPLRDSEGLLAKARQDRNDKVDRSDAEKQTIDSDLSKLATLK